MSQMSRKLPRHQAAAVAALPPKADTNAAGQYFRNGPIADIRPRKRDGPHYWKNNPFTGLTDNA